MKERNSSLSSRNTLYFALKHVTRNITIIKVFKKLLGRHREKHPQVDVKYLIPRQNHPISKTDINENALKVLNTLTSAGFQAYLVGGSVRDLLLRKSPKDFDIATSATPNEIKKLFRNARIIGRRFKLVHVIFQKEVIEVATFRGDHTTAAESNINEKGMLTSDNVYGTLHEDAFRRDFTVNSLYYAIEDASIIDFAGGFADVHSKTLRIIGDPLTRFQEDPVRMIRAVRFAAKLEFTLDKKTEAPIKELASLLSHISPARLFDDMTKLFQCGAAEQAYPLLKKYNLFAVLFPLTDRAVNNSTYAVEPFLLNSFANTDARIHENKPITPAFVFAVLLWFPLRIAIDELLKNEKIDPLSALEKAMSQVLSTQCRHTAIPKRFTQVIREIWVLQYRLPKRQGNRAHHLIAHPRFRAAFDFMALRALANDESLPLVTWWQDFQDASPEQRQIMIDELNADSEVKKRKKRRKKKKVPAIILPPPENNA